MSNNPSRLARLSRALALRLERLRESLETLAQQLRDALARAVSEAVGESVRTAIRTVFHDATGTASWRDHDDWNHRRAASRWHDQAEDNPDHWWREEPEYRDEFDEPDRTPAVKPTPASPSRWAPALGLACRAALWWLRRQVGRYPLLAAAGVGLVAAVGAYAGAPMVGSAGLASAAVGLVALAEAVDAGAALATPTQP